MKIMELDVADLGEVAGGAIRVPLDVALALAKAGGVQNGGPSAGGGGGGSRPMSAADRNKLNRILDMIRRNTTVP
jgi:hypothetical protein